MWTRNSSKFECVAEILCGLEPFGGVIYRNVISSGIAVVAQVLLSRYVHMLDNGLNYFAPDRLLMQ